MHLWGYSLGFVGFIWPLLVKQSTPSRKLAWFYSSVFNSLNTERSLSITKWTGIEGTTFSSFKQSCTAEQTSGTGQKLHSLPLGRNSASLQRLPPEASQHTVLPCSSMAFALEPPSPSLLTDEYSLEKNVLNAIYPTNIDIYTKFLSAVHYLTTSTDCPHPANNFQQFFHSPWTPT